MADLTVHPHLRRIEVDTPNGVVSYSAPAAIFVGEQRHYGAVPAIGEHVELPKTARAGSKQPSHDRSPKLDLDHLRQWIGRTTRGLRHRHRATGEGPARDAVPGDRRAEDRRCRAVHGALVPGAAGVSDVDARPRRPSDPRRLPAAGAAAAPDVGRRRTGIPRHAARRRRAEAHLAHLGRDAEDRLDRHTVLRLGRARRHDAARHRDPRAAGHRLSRHGRRSRRAGEAPPPPPVAKHRETHVAIPCCCSAIRR